MVEADKMLTDDMGPYERNVDKYGTKYMWNQNEFDALVSFAYNVGSIDQLTAKGTRSRAEISEKILAYNRGGGKILAGLTRRRQAEQKLFLTPISEQKKKGWQQEDGDWKYYLGNGEPVRNAWYKYKDKWYYLGADGAMLTGQQTIDGKWYVLNEDGAMVTDPVTLTPDQDGALTWPGLKE